MSFVPIILACLMQDGKIDEKYCLNFVGDQMEETDCIDHHRDFMDDFQMQHPEWKILKFGCVPNSNDSEIEGQAA